MYTYAYKFGKKIFNKIKCEWMYTVCLSVVDFVMAYLYDTFMDYEQVLARVLPLKYYIIRGVVFAFWRK